MLSSFWTFFRQVAHLVRDIRRRKHRHHTGPVFGDRVASQHQRGVRFDIGRVLAQPLDQELDVVFLTRQENPAALVHALLFGERFHRFRGVALRVDAERHVPDFILDRRHHRCARLLELLCLHRAGEFAVGEDETDQHHAALQHVAVETLFFAVLVDHLGVGEIVACLFLCCRVTGRYLTQLQHWTGEHYP